MYGRMTQEDGIWYLMLWIMKIHTQNRRVFHDFQPYYSRVQRFFASLNHHESSWNLGDWDGTKVKEWLLEAGLIIELDGLGAKIIGKAPFLVVTWKRFGKRGMTFWCFFPEPKNWSFKWNIYGSKSAAFVQYIHGILCTFTIYIIIHLRYILYQQWLYTVYLLVFN